MMGVNVTKKHKNQRAKASDERDALARASGDKEVLSLEESAAVVDVDVRLLSRALRRAQHAHDGVMESFFDKGIGPDDDVKAIETEAIEAAKRAGLVGAKPSNAAGYRILRSELLAWVARGMPGTEADIDEVRQ